MPFHQLKRRDFICLLGGATASSILCPLVAHAQQPGPMRRIGVIIPLAADDPESLARVGAFLQGLQQLGWTIGGNVRIDYRWGAGNANLYRRYAEELIELAPDIVLANGGPATAALQQASRTVPIVFVNVSDPVGGGLVTSLARPGGNATGFALPEYGVSGKWLELLKQIAPRVTRVAVIRDPTVASGSGQLGAIQAVGPFLGMEVSPIDARDADEIERGITAFARGANAGLIVPQSAAGLMHRNLILTLAARHRLPAVYAYRAFVVSGGLISYGADTTDQWRQAAGYVDRILKGEKSADLPVQAPTKYETVINLKTAKALGLEVPATVLARADEVIE